MEFYNFYSDLSVSYFCLYDYYIILLLYDNFMFLYKKSYLKIGVGRVAQSV
jgi:hypothetical protein